jgi:hypothetical protein
VFLIEKEFDSEGLTEVHPRFFMDENGNIFIYIENKETGDLEFKGQLNVIESESSTENPA